MKLRRFGALALSILSGAALAQDARITLDFTCAPLHKVLSEVSRQTGVRLEAGSLADRPVMVQTSGMNPKAFYDAIAKVLDAEWTKAGEGFVLTRENSRQRIAESREIEARTPLMAKAIEQFLEKNASAADWSDATIDKRLREDSEKRKQVPGQLGVDMVVEIMDNMTMTPATLVLVEAARKIPARMIAGVLPGQRLVLSSAPNRMQKPLPYVPASLNDYVRAYNRLAEAARAQASPENPNARIQTPLTRRRNGIDRVAELLVTIDGSTSGQSLAVTLVDASGEILDRTQTWLAEPAAGEGDVPNGVSGEVEFSPLSQDVLRALTPTVASARVVEGFSIAIAMESGLMGRLGNDVDRPNLPDAVRAALADPMSRDPHETFLAELMRGVAKERGKDFVAALPDYAFVTLARKVKGARMKLADFYRLLPSLKLTVEHGETTLVYASNQAEAYRSRVSRAELARVLKADAEKGFLSLDELCRYALAMPRWSPTNMDAAILKVMVPSACQEYEMGRNAFLKLYATLTPAQRLENQNRVILPLTQLSPQQRLIVEEIVYSGTGGLIIGNGVMMTTAVRGRNSAEPPREPAIAMIEPTEAFPNGIPTNTILQISRRIQDGVFALNAKGQGTMLTAGDLGMRLGYNPPPGMPVTVNKDFAHYMAAELTEVDLTLQFGRRSRGADNLMDARIKDKTKLSYDQLPEAFKQNVERARQRAANMRFMTSPGNRNIPPRP